jgi:hypothetical protein
MKMATSITALLLVALEGAAMSVAFADPIEQCSQQSECVTFDVTCDATNTAAYRVCMKLALNNPACIKKACTISHICTSGDYRVTDDTCTTGSCSIRDVCLSPEGGCKINDPSDETEICEVRECVHLMRVAMTYA